MGYAISFTFIIAAVIGSAYGFFATGNDAFFWLTLAIAAVAIIMTFVMVHTHKDGPWNGGSS